jgi:hypothetical protein
MTDVETASVSIDVAPLIPITGKGDIRYLASATLLIGGIELRLDGFLVREDRGHRMRVNMPGFRHPKTGTLEPAVKLPRDLEFAIAQAILEMVPGGQLVRLPMPEDAR